MPKNLTVGDVTLSPRAKRFARDHRLTERQLKAARAGASVCTHETPGFICVDGALESGLRVRFYCSPARPGQVCGVRELAA